ncbi:MAG: alpha/beta hydrolase [Alphaproteobacteria bacterium]|nr:alpha/beta hydrolase [Alphaproteobacteria bacterium]
MRVAEADLLFVPGLGGSGPGHWQTRWRERLSTARTVEQDDWHNADLPLWRERIAQEIAAAERPVVLLAHSLGVLAAAHASAIIADTIAASAATAGAKIRGAFFVAPPSRAGMATASCIDPAFCDMPRGPLNFPSLLVASRNDPWSSYDDAENLALDWGAQIIDAGEAGHLNTDSGHGPWPEGLMRFAAFLGKL